ncbi:hypothetical protein RI129_008333 [Pyrocoelia pectoralis]|uniref:Peptidase S1 domain-containing protein n=1 Tax=Pyrocoelia pectoralis TaxID=417401 RepID=A0AAN7VBT1_9COLE
MKLYQLSIFWAVKVALHLVSSEKRSGFESRIHNGTAAKIGQFPWQAYLDVDLRDSYVKEGGAALISNKWLLTAAHCVSDAINITVVLGTTLRGGQDPSAFRTKTNEFYIHENYNNVTLDNDIALIKMKIAVTFTRNITAIPLGGYLEEFVSVTVSGWGDTRQDLSEGMEMSDILYYTELTAIPNDLCIQLRNDSINEKQVCTISDGTSGACRGDSGGPLVRLVNGTWTHVGIVSFGTGFNCSLPTGYIRTDSYREWIKSTMKKHSKKCSFKKL